MTPPVRVFQVDQMAAGSLDGMSVADAEAWLAIERDTGRTEAFYHTRGWVEPTPRACPWAATWYVEHDGVLKFYRSNWVTSG